MLYLAVLLPFIAHFLPTENKNIKLAISIAPAIFIILFRWGLGTDYFSYEYFFNNHDVSSLMNALKYQPLKLERGFVIIIYIFRSLSIPFQGFIAFFGMVIYLVFIKWLIDTNKDTELSIMGCLTECSL